MPRTSLLTSLQGDKLYIGTATGNIHIYDLNEGTDTGAFVFTRVHPRLPSSARVRRSDEGATPTATLVGTKTGISRRAIDQLGYIKDVNSLVVLSGSRLSYLLGCAHSSILVSFQKRS